MYIMISHVVGLTLIGSMRPYFRKHVLNTLETHDFLFMNAFIIAIIIFCFFTYTYFFENHVIKKTYKNCCQLTFTQMLSLVIIACFTVFSSFLIIDIDKNFNTPSLNFIIIKSVSILALFLVGIFIFKESYNVKQTIGILLTVSGILILLSNQPKQSD